MTNHTIRPLFWQGKAFDFKVEEMTLPNGRHSTIAMIHHPGSCAIVPVRADHSVMLLRQYRPAIQAFIWEVPAGTMHRGEDPLDCAKRELQEECGLIGDRFEKIGEILTAPGYSDEQIHMFLAMELIPSKQDLDEDELLEIHSFTFEQVRGMIKGGEIQDAMSIVSLDRAYSKLKEDPRHPIQCSNTSR